MAAGVVVVVVVAWLFLPGWIKPSIDRNDLRTAVAERGAMEETLTASGLVMPQHEHVITSPTQSHVVEILRRPGDAIRPGTPIAQLDVAEAQLAVERLERQISLKKNERVLARIELENQLAERAGQEAIKRLELKSFEYARDRNAKLFEQGLIVEDTARQSATDAQRARIELEQLEASKGNMERAATARLAAIDLETEILEKEAADARDLLAQGTTTSQRAGVLTWVVTSEGTAVNRGDELARVADLSSFKVEATLSDVHAARVRVGQPATVRSGDHRLGGTITKVLPTVENGIVRLEVQLDEPSDPVLRHNLRVDTFVVVDRREDTVLVKRGTFPMVDGQHVAFVVRGDRALRTPITLGLTSFEQYEITQGIQEGDEVVVSDMTDYRNRKEVRIK